MQAKREPKVRHVWRSGMWRSVSGIAVASACAMAIASAGALGAPTPVAGASPPARQVVQHTSLCASTATLIRLIVHRTEAFPQNHFHFTFPTSVVVREVAAVRRVAGALCALPAMPDEAMQCPANFGITYHLEFSSAQRNFPVVTLDATGCQSVQGLVRPRWIARSPRFWRALGTAMHLEHPSWATFRGTGPTG